MNHAVAASSDAARIQRDEGGSQPTLLLQLFDLGEPEFGDWLTVRSVSIATAAGWFAQYHYSGTPGTGSSEFYGVFAGDLMAVIGLGFPGYINQVGAKFGLEAYRGTREIARVAVHPHAPRNSASRCIARVLKVITKDDWLFSYADTGQGHHGGIYQALGAVYVGMSPGEAGYLVDGVRVHPRSLVDRYGSRSADTLQQLQSRGVDIVRVEGLNAPKHTYILPIGPRATEVRRSLAPFRRPYPKRET